MTFPVFRPLIISATFVLCSAFAGNCRAEADLPCTEMIKQNKVIILDGATCFSKALLPACPVLCRPSVAEERNIPFSCFRPGELSPFDRLVTTTIPQACEIILPVNISPDTTP